MCFWEKRLVGQHGHASLSVFGIGAELSMQAWRSVVRQLIVNGYLRSDAERYGALVLTESSRALLRGDTTIEFREEPKKQASVARPAAKRSRPIADDERDLWEALRACRQTLATEHDVPPYVIFHDKTLHQMLDERPQTESDLLQISGVGQTKLDRYGEQFLSVLRSGGGATR